MALHKKVNPQGFLLNDNDTGVDHLGEITYADAIADSIHQVKTPITIGLFARWGSGKSFLLRHLESILRRYQKQEEVDLRTRKNRKRRGTCACKCVKIRKGLKFFPLLALICAFICSLLLVFKPSIYLPRRDEPTPDYITYKFSNSNTTFAPTTTASNGYHSSTVNLRIVGIVLLSIEILATFLITCCGNTWLSPNYYGSFRLITYGTFTKLPGQNPQKDIVQDPGESAAEVLIHVERSDESLALAAASESTSITRRYIFVDFKAWEYAGSDNLWAAIVTKLSDVIEAEFGRITARLFRMISVKEIPKNVIRRNFRTIDVKFGNITEKEVQEIMKQYGVVTSIERGKGESWFVTYSTDGELRNAMDSLRIRGIDVEVKETRKQKKKKRHFLKRGTNDRKSKKPLLGSKDNIEMRDRNVNQNNSNSDDLFILPKESFSCRRFCSHFIKYPVKLFGLPRMVWWILLFFLSFFIPVTLYIISDMLGIEVFRTYRPVTVPAQILLWLPASSAVTLVGCRFFWAMCHSQRRRINKALDGTRTNMAEELGFMDKVKTEVEVITKLIHCARFTHQRDYKVFITIDDLDRVPLNKVRSVLEAVNILLSDKSSPFICVIAVDPRIVVKCIEEGTQSILTKANVSGHEYLKKIINLPICLPEMDGAGKKRFIAGLIDQADRTTNFRAQIQHPPSTNSAPDEGSGTNLSKGTGHGFDESILTVPDGGQRDTAFSFDRTHPRAQDIPPQPSSPTPPVSPTTPIAPETLSHDEFLFQCREFIYFEEELHRHMRGNPRDMKRVFNVISLIATIIKTIIKKQEDMELIRNIVGDPTTANSAPMLVRNKQLAKNLVRWVVLTDQWPYRTSYILQVIEDAEQRVQAGIPDEEIPDDWTIFEIFENKVCGEMSKTDNSRIDRSLLTLDGDPDLFFSYLKVLKRCKFTKSRLLEYEKYAINLDYSIRHSIAFGRDLSCLCGVSQEAPVQNAEPEQDNENIQNRDEENNRGNVHRAEVHVDENRME